MNISMNTALNKVNRHELIHFKSFSRLLDRPVLRGDLHMIYGTPQSGPQSTCLPIGVGLSYDELTLLSCDVHRNSQNVRLFDIQTGQLKHTISSTPVISNTLLVKTKWI